MGEWPDEAVEAAAKALTEEAFSHRDLTLTEEDWNDLRDSCMTGMRAAIAALAPWIEGDGWQDIASAPLGRDLVLYLPKVAWADAAVVVGRADSKFGLESSGYGYFRTASHWCPLPNPVLQGER